MVTIPEGGTIQVMARLNDGDPPGIEVHTYPTGRERSFIFLATFQ